MTTQWPPPADAAGDGLLANVDVEAMPHAKHFAACLQVLASSSDFHASIPFVGDLAGRIYEVHNQGVFDDGHQPSSLPVATSEYYSELPSESCRYVSTVIEYLGTTPEHFMAFAQVLSGQDVNIGDKGYVGGDNYDTPIDRAYFNLALGQFVETPEGTWAVNFADYSKLNDVLQAVLEADWDSDAQLALAAKVNHLMNFLVFFRGRLYAEFGATLVAYATLVRSARTRLDGLMAQADAAMRRLEANVEVDPVKVLSILLTLAGFIPALPYSITFGVGVAALAVSELEKQSGAEKNPEDIKIPGDRSHSCVDILRWYLDEARATCEHLADGIKNLSERLPALFGDVKAAAAGFHIPGELNALLP